MLFSGDEVNKPVNVLSGEEKVRVMLSKLMLKSNVLILDDQQIAELRVNFKVNHLCQS